MWWCCGVVASWRCLSREGVSYLLVHVRNQRLTSRDCGSGTSAMAPAGKCDRRLTAGKGAHTSFVGRTSDDMLRHVASVQLFDIRAANSRHVQSLAKAAALPKWKTQKNETQRMKYSSLNLHTLALILHEAVPSESWGCSEIQHFAINFMPDVAASLASTCQLAAWSWQCCTVVYFRPSLLRPRGSTSLAPLGAALHCI